MIECIPPPSPRSASSSTRSIRRTPVRLTRYCPSPPRCRRRAIESSEKSTGPSPSALSNSSSTSQKSVAFRPAAPAKSTSSGFSARSSDGASEPAAQTIPSETFDFPEPFGPTTTATPGSSRISTGSGNDLKPRSLIALRCTRGRHGAARMTDAAARRLLRRTTEPCRAPRAQPPARRPSSSGQCPCPPARPSTSAAHVNVRSCGGPSVLERDVLDALAPLRELLLERRLLVDRLGRAPPRSAARTPRSPGRRARRGRARGRAPRAPPP